jgi:hypothetical protein
MWWNILLLFFCTFFCFSVLSTSQHRLCVDRHGGLDVQIDCHLHTHDGEHDTQLPANPGIVMMSSNVHLWPKGMQCMLGMVCSFTTTRHQYRTMWQPWRHNVHTQVLWLTFNIDHVLFTRQCRCADRHGGCEFQMDCHAHTHGGES